MKLKQIVESFEALKNISELSTPAKTGYKIAKTLKKVSKEYDLFQEQRRKIVIENGEEQEDKTFKVKEDKISYVNEELDKLLDTDVELAFEKIKIDDLGDVKPRALDLVLTDWLWEE